jgi:dolichyl-phosphate-mannose-protein mannosyltransferase
MAAPKKETPSSSAPATPKSPSSLDRASLPLYLQPAAPLLATVAGLPARIRSLLCLLVISLLASCMYFVGNDQPPYPFWDENYHMTSAQRYVEGLGHFEPHPPLGLLLIAAGESMSHANDAVNKHQLVVDKYLEGDKLPPGFSFAGMRMMPSLFAAATALLFFGLMLSLTENRLFALLFSTLYLFENAYIVHFRAVHLDSFQMFFCVGLLWTFIHLWKRAAPLKWPHYVGMGALVALAMMVKINAAVFLMLFPLIYFKDAASQIRPLIERPTDFLLKTGVTIVTILAVFLAVFAVHVAIGHKMPDLATSAARQDLENMSPPYREYLAQNQSISPTIVVSAMSDYFKFMDKDHLGVPKLDICKPGENGSHPLHWPVHDKTINYRWDSADGKTSYVQLTGNQFSWFLGLAAVIYSLILIINHRLNKLPVDNARTYHLIEVFTGLYIVFMALHLYLGTQRVMYLYHYFLGLLLTYVLLVLNWIYLSDLHKASMRQRIGTASLIAGCIIASCLFFLPLNNHWPLSKGQCEMRNVFMQIVECQ